EWGVLLDWRWVCLSRRCCCGSACEACGEISVYECCGVVEDCGRTRNGGVGDRLREREGLAYGAGDSGVRATHLEGDARVHGSGTCNGRDLAGRIECEAAGAALGEKIGREREWRSAGTDGLGECVCDGGER